MFCQGCATKSVPLNYDTLRSKKEKRFLIGSKFSLSRAGKSPRAPLSLNFEFFGNASQNRFCLTLKQRTRWTSRLIRRTGSGMDDAQVEKRYYLPESTLWGWIFLCESALAANDVETRTRSGLPRDGTVPWRLIDSYFERWYPPCKPMTQLFSDARHDCYLPGLRMRVALLWPLSFWRNLSYLRLFRSRVKRSVSV